MPEYRVFYLSLFYNGNGHISHTFALELKKKKYIFQYEPQRLRGKEFCEYS